MNRQLLPVLLVILVNMLGIGVILPLLPYYAGSFGADAATIGVLLATYAGCQLFAGPLLGRLSDRYGRKPVLLATEAMNAVGYLLMALADGLPLLFAARALQGLTGGNIPVAQAVIADLTDEGQRTRAYGLSGAAFGIGFIAGPALGAALATFGYWLPAAVAAVLATLAFVLVLVLLPETRDASAAPRAIANPWRAAAGVLARPHLGALLRTGLMYTFAFSLYQTTYVLVLDQRFAMAPQEAGFMLMYGGIVIVLAQTLLLPRLTRRFDERALVRMGMATVALATAASILVPAWPALLITSGLVTVGAAMTNPALLALISQFAGQQERGVVLGVQSALQSLAGVVAPLAGGLALQVAGTAAPWALTAACAAAALLLFSRLFAGRARHELAPVPEHEPATKSSRPTTANAA